VAVPVQPRQTPGGSADASLSPALLLKLAVAFGLSFLIVNRVPHPGPGAVVPTVHSLLRIGALVGGVTGIALYLGVRYDLKLPTRVAIYAVAYNLLVVLVKFVLAPAGLYEANRRQEFDTNFGASEIAIGVALIVFALYAFAFYVIYRLFRSRVEHLPNSDASPPSGARWLVVVLFVAVIVFGGGLVGLTLMLFSGLAGLQYLTILLSTGVAVVIALALAGAVSLAALAFDSTAKRAEAVGDAAIVTSFFWVGLAFLAVYHVLWVVYILALTTAWPLKVVAAK
jgi:hypothetical protein